MDDAPADRKREDVRHGVMFTSSFLKPLVSRSCLRPLRPADPRPSSPSLVLGKAGEGSSADGCSEPEGGGDNRDGLLLLLVSLLKTADWLLPLLWMGLEVQSSPGCFFWMSGRGQRTEKKWQKSYCAGVEQQNQQIFQD